MRNARPCKVQRFTVAEVMFTKMCNCYFGARESSGAAGCCRFALFAHMMSPIGAGQILPEIHGCSEIFRWIQSGTFQSDGDVGVCRTRLSVVCGRCVKKASHMFNQPTEIKVEPLWLPTRHVEICLCTQTAHLLKVIFRCRCSGDLQIGQSCQCKWATFASSLVRGSLKKSAFRQRGVLNAQVVFFPWLFEEDDSF